MLFNGHNGVTDIIGVVPDEVSAVEIVGQTIKVTNNVWHYRSQPGDFLGFVVSADDGTTASLNGG